MAIQTTIVTGVLSSVIASIVFYLLMILIRPRFIISNKICISNREQNIIEYKIKVVNRTRNIITNVSYSLLYCVVGEDGIKDVVSLPPLKEPLKNISKYDKKNDDYAIRFTYNIDDEKYPLKENTMFIFTFQAYHAFSNAMRIKKVVYCKKDAMEGIFETKESVKIIATKRKNLC